jgi:hypothetical protein
LLRDEADRAIVRRALLPRRPASCEHVARRHRRGRLPRSGHHLPARCRNRYPRHRALLLVADTTLALRLTNAAQIVLLFPVGYSWAQHAGANRWKTGATIASLAVGLVLVAVVLGG